MPRIACGDERRRAVRSHGSRSIRSCVRSHCMLEGAGMMAEVPTTGSARVFISSETARTDGAVPPTRPHGLIGQSLIARATDEHYADLVASPRRAAPPGRDTTCRSCAGMCSPATPDFDEVFGRARPVRGEGRAGRGAASRLARHALVPARPAVPPDDARRPAPGLSCASTTTPGASSASSGSYRGRCRESLLHAPWPRRPGLFERMERVSEPGRRAAGDPVRRPRGLRRALAAPVVARLLRPRSAT